MDPYITEQQDGYTPMGYLQTRGQVDADFINRFLEEIQGFACCVDDETGDEVYEVGDLAECYGIVEKHLGGEAA